MNNHKPCIIILKNPLGVAEYAANRFVSISKESEQEKTIKHIALSGGSTPVLLFKILTSDTYNHQINWHNIHLWWGDERAVPPDHPESNFGNAQKLLLRKIDIPLNNIHRIKAELEPNTAAEKYQQEMIDNITLISNIPVFDWTILGMGEDGHTASLFNTDDNFYVDKLTAVTTHTQSGQKRITLTPKSLCASILITFMVTGKNKSTMINQILGKTIPASNYPAGLIKSKEGITEWVIDEEASDQ